MAEVIEKLIYLASTDKFANALLEKITNKEISLEEALWNIIELQRSELSIIRSDMVVAEAMRKESYH